MKKSRYSESQIVKALKEVEGGRAVKDLCRGMGVSDATYYNWKSKYGGMEALDIKRLKELEDENRRLKQMYADLSLDKRMLKGLKPTARRSLVVYLKESFSASLRRACRVVGISDSVYRYKLPLGILGEFIACTAS